MLFYDVTQPRETVGDDSILTFGDYSQHAILGNGSGTTLAERLGGAVAHFAGKNMYNRPVTLLGSNFWAGKDELGGTFQGNVLLHELLHGFGLSDADFFNRFTGHGLENAGWLDRGDTHEITEWLSRDCKPKE